jgi:hypothetical protein
MREGTNEKKVKVITEKGPEFEKKKEAAYRLIREFAEKEASKDQSTKKE